MAPQCLWDEIQFLCRVLLGCPLQAPPLSLTDLKLHGRSSLSHAGFLLFTFLFWESLHSSIPTPTPTVLPVTLSSFKIHLGHDLFPEALPDLLPQLS